MEIRTDTVEFKSGHGYKLNAILIYFINNLRWYEIKEAPSF